MPTMLRVSLATGYYDRTAPIIDGRVKIDGCETNCLLVEPPGEIFHRAFRFQEFDIAELSLSSHTITLARGDSKYVAVPAFPLRKFRHSGIYIRKDRGISKPEDLRGKTIGVPEFQQTANVWLRGILQDEYGVDIREVKWRTGGRNEPGRQERLEIQLPSDIDCRPIPSGQTLSNLLEEGGIDALISPQPPICFSRREPCRWIDHLFPDYPKVELEYFRRTKIFPIMHVVGIRRALVEENPWLPVNVLKAFLKAKEMIDLRNSTILPWAAAEYARMKRLLGDDYWSYGLEANRHVLSTFIRYLTNQGLIKREMSCEEIFNSSSLSLFHS